MSLHIPRPVLGPLRPAALAPALLVLTLAPAFAAPTAPAMPAAPSPGDTMTLLFADRSFGDAGAGGLTWRLERHGPAAEGFRPITGGRLTLGPATDPADGKPLLELREASEGLDRVVARYPATGVDPVLIYFLENATRGMAAIAGGFAWLAVVAALNMALALYYYAAIVAEMYFHEPERTKAVAARAGYAWAIGLCTAGTIAFGAIPTLALSVAQLGSSMLR